MNQYQLDLGFDCNSDGVPDTVEIFQRTAETSCCRILPRDTSRRAAFPKAISDAPIPVKPLSEVFSTAAGVEVAPDVPQGLVVPEAPSRLSLSSLFRRDNSRRK